MSKPIVFIDAETTGTDVVNDRIVQLAVLKTIDFNVSEQKEALFYPGIPIPKEATDVHGITDDMVKDKPKFEQYAASLYQYLKDCDYAGFNILQFDVPILSEEFGRCGIDWPSKDVCFFDSFHVFREKEKRDLTAAVKFYCNESHDGAHDAMADVHAAMKVMKSQMLLYPDVDSIEKYASFCKNPKALDLAGKIVLNDNGHAVYGFGKDKGKVIKYNPSFGKWMLTQNFPTNTKNVLKALIA